VEAVVVLRREAAHCDGDVLLVENRVKALVLLVVAEEEAVDRELLPLDPAVRRSLEWRLPELLGAVDAVKDTHPAVGGGRDDCRICRRRDGPRGGDEAAREERVECLDRG